MLNIKRLSVGFTLIELLIVIAILGVLAGGILVAINPLEQLSRGRDAGRKTTIQQLGNAVQSYYTSQGAVYPTEDNVWMTTLQTSGELKTTPNNPSGTGYVSGCTGGGAVQNGYCYQTNGTDAIVYGRAEAKGSITAATCASSSDIVWVVWSSAEGKTGLTCTPNANTDPAVGVTGLK
ncbi:MAG TPA: type II secretion system protein [Patescibacteria group bacterium]|nr:type II secretion system protein [Patescibacteria group bacterium]